MKNYRLTQRGKIVFTSLLILFIIALVMLVSQLNKASQLASQELTENVKELDKDGETNDLLINDKKMDEDDGLETSKSPSIESEDESINELELETTDDSNKKDKEEIAKKEELSSLYTIYYLPDQEDIDKEDVLILDKYYDIAINTNSDIIIEGNYNGEMDHIRSMFVCLSYNRALIVKNYLIDKGISEDRLIIVNNEDKNPVNKDNSDFEIGLNRRVDIYFKDFYEGNIE